MIRLHVWLDGVVMFGMRGVGDSCVGHGGMLGIFTLRGAGVCGIFGGGGAIGTLGSGGAVGTSTLRGEGAVGTGNLEGRAGIPDQRVNGGMVWVSGLGTGRANFMIMDNCSSACVCSMPNFAVGEAGCG